MKKRFFLLSALAAVAVVPGVVSANLVLDMPPILAGNGSNSCTADSDCSSGVCCNSRCYASGVCCNGNICYTSCVSNVCEAVVGNGKLNDTGITTLKATGDDSQYGRDKTNNIDTDGYAGFSFTKVVDVETCIQDNVTGLTWSPSQAAMSFADASALNPTICGLTGWRIPTIKELVSIVSYHRTSPAIDNDATRGFFADTQNAVYWTSTPNAADNTKVWGVNFVKGNADNTILKSGNTFPVRLVRP